MQNESNVSCGFCHRSPPWLAALGFGLAVNLAAQPSPQFSSLRATNQEMRLQLTASKAWNYQIDATTNLAAWLPLVILTNSAGAFEHLDSATPWLPSRFYRAQQLTNRSAITGDFLRTDDGEVLIHPIHHATLLITWQNQAIYVDPVPVSGFSYGGLPRANLILVTHDHSDHFDPGTISAIKATNAVLLTTRTVYQNLSSTLRAITGVLTNGVTTNWLGLGVKAIPAYNLTSQNHPKGIGNGYILTFGGQQVYISGDTDDIPDMRALRDIDVAFIVMDGTYNMGVTTAASAVRQFQPKVVYPYHYNTANPATFKQLVGTNLTVEVRLRKWE